MRYTALAQTLTPLTYENISTVYGYPEKINDSEISACHPDEWMIVDAWDLS